MNNGREWEEANEEILAKRDVATQVPFPAVVQLQAVVSSEITFQQRLWQGDYVDALAAAETVLGGLDDTNLRGYRALWHYLAGSAAWLASKDSGNTSLSSKARLHFSRAKEAAPGVFWLVGLSRFQDEVTATRSQENEQTVYEQVERLEQVLARLGTVHDRQYSAREKEILDGLNSAEKFEYAQRLLGEVLGFEAGKEESDASPDPWWISGKICIVFEDHAGAQPTSTLDATKARQAFTHPNWMKEKALLSDDMKVIPVLVTPVVQAKSGAKPHLHDVALWPLDDFRRWATDALGVLRELRRTFSEPGDLFWRSEAAHMFEEKGMDAESLWKRLRANSAADGFSFVD